MDTAALRAAHREGRDFRVEWLDRKSMSATQPVYSTLFWTTG